MILLDARRIKAYEALERLGAAAGRSEEELEELWGGLLLDEALMGEFMYYLDHHSFYDGVRCAGYGLTDLYFYNMRRFEMRQDIGKNYADCDKDALALDTFLLMSRMQRDPERYVQKLSGGLGMDQV